MTEPAPVRPVPAMPEGFVPLTVEEAVAALEAGAFALSEDEPPYRKQGDKIVHAVGSFTGADWNLAGAVEFVRAADMVGWLPGSFMGHDLVATGPEGRYRFQIAAPQPSA